MFYFTIQRFLFNSHGVASSWGLSKQIALNTAKLNLTKSKSQIILWDFYRFLLAEQRSSEAYERVWLADPAMFGLIDVQKKSGKYPPRITSHELSPALGSNRVQMVNWVSKCSFQGQGFLLFYLSYIIAGLLLKNVTKC